MIDFRYANNSDFLISNKLYEQFHQKYLKLLIGARQQNSYRYKLMVYIKVKPGLEYVTVPYFSLVCPEAQINGSGFQCFSFPELECLLKATKESLCETLHLYQKNSHTFCWFDS